MIDGTRRTISEFSNNCLTVLVRLPDSAAVDRVFSMKPGKRPHPQQVTEIVVLQSDNQTGFPCMFRLQPLLRGTHGCTGSAVVAKNFFPLKRRFSPERFSHSSGQPIRPVFWAGVVAERKFGLVRPIFCIQKSVEDAEVIFEFIPQSLQAKNAGRVCRMRSGDGVKKSTVGTAINSIKRITE